MGETNNLVDAIKMEGGGLQLEGGDNESQCIFKGHPCGLKGVKRDLKIVKVWEGAIYA